MTASNGFWRRTLRARARLRLALSLLPLGVPLAAQARDTRIDIPATTLDVALSLLARETGADVISTEAGLGKIRVPAIRGAASARQALDRMLHGSGFRAIAVDAHSFRIVRAALPAPPPSPPPSPAPPRHPHVRAPEPSPAVEVIVTASKQHIPLLRFPGSITSVDSSLGSIAGAAPDMSVVAHSTPVLQTTELGAGRDKIFIRGIADSSFNGATQSTASSYFGDVQLGYSGADPGLRLYDMKSIEVMEGPQGTLYGSGSIGGVIRLTPNPVDLTRVGASLASGVTLTDHGAPGADLGGMVNLPIRAETLGLRLVAYRVRDGGFIDDPERGATDINRTDTTGARGELALDPGDGWHVQLGGLWQRIDARDSQYAERDVGALDHAAAIAQPYHTDIALGRLVLTKDWDSGLQLLSVNGVVTTHSADLYDASLDTQPLAYDTDGAKLLLTHETRLSRSLANGSSWVAGFTLLSSRDAQSRSVGPPGAQADILGVTNVTRSASLFAESTVALSSNFAATLGARLTAARTDGEPSTEPRSRDFVRGRSTLRVDPTLGFSWRLSDGLAMFGRFQTGYRTGGIAVARGIGRVADFLPDSIRVGEIGLRHVRKSELGLAYSASVSLARWTNIQADLVNRRGIPYTANIGDARIEAVEATADWVPVRGLHAVASFLYTHNSVTGPLADLSSPANRHLPETPPFAGKAALSYQWSIGRAGQLKLGGSADYIGRSVLGTGDLLDISQGRYVVLGVSGDWIWQRYDVSLTLDNLANRRDNQFAYGNPFTLADRDQTTPLRPFSVRLGVAIAL